MVNAPSGPYTLIADPNEARGGRTATLVEPTGLPFVCVLDGRQAIAVLERRGPPALLVTELSLPRTAGFAIIRHLRTMPGGAASRVVILSAFAELRQSMEHRREKYHLEAIVGFDAPPEELARVLRGGPQAARASVSPPLPSQPQAEIRRLQSVSRVIAQSPPTSDATLHDLVQRVARKFGVSVALVSLVLEDRQWFKAKVGLAMSGTPRDVSFCRHVVLAREPMVVPDATEHPTFRTNRLVTEGVVRGYAGAPLVGSDGEVWGSLCIIDPDRPLDLNALELMELARLAEEVVAVLEGGARVAEG